MTTRCCWLMLMGLVAGGGGTLPAAESPNVVIFLADDLGYSDLGCYGGEIATPNLDQLAAGGLRFTQFYNTARCWPSRAVLLTGYYAQQVRRDTVPELPYATGGQGLRQPWAELLPARLKSVGYRSYHSGKWHVDGKPVENGFDRSYWVQDQDRFFNPKVHYEDDVALPAVEPDSGYYATVAIADHAVKCLREHAERHAGTPFFHYVAFTCPHFPLQALREDVARYRGKFRHGWDELRGERLARMTELGLVKCELSERTPGVPAWEELSGREQRAWEERMEVHAAMVDRMDREIGRVLNQLLAMDAFDNTLILFASDNGASAEKILRGDGHDPTAALGSGATYRCLEPGWANLANAPLRRSKIFVHEGGISTPLIACWVNGITSRGELRHTPAHLIDVVPTVLEVTGGALPEVFQNEPQPALPGHSLTPLFAEDGAAQHEELWWFHSGNRAIRAGDWKLVSEGEGPWELYNLGIDRSETLNLAEGFPEKVAKLAARWEAKLAEFRAVAERNPPPARAAAGANKKGGKKGAKSE